MTETRGSKTNSVSSDGGSFEEIIGGKKRKVWRALNVSQTVTTNGRSPITTSSGTMLTPEAAANYLQQAAASAASAASGGSSEAVQIMLGPNGLTAGVGDGRGGTTSASFGSLDLAALAKAGDLSALTTAAARNMSSLKAATSDGSLPNGKNGKDSLPCSEAEMKALMSMFVEIMGMSMDTGKLGKKRSKANGSTNSFPLPLFGDSKNPPPPPPPGGWPDPTIAALIGDLSALNQNQNYDDEEEEDDSLPDLDDMNDVGQKENAASLEAIASKLANVSTPSSITGLDGIAPVEWDSLEEVAIEDAKESEERARRAAKRREKKIRRKERARTEANLRAAEAAAKKREKLVLSWRSRVISACQANETLKLEVLISESPFRSEVCGKTTLSDETSVEDGESQTDSMLSHLEFLLPSTVPKNRQQLQRGREARQLLAEYIFTTSLPMVFRSFLRTGRSPLQTACFYGDLEFIKASLERVKDSLQRSYLNMTCQDSGFSSLHYAVLSGSNEVVEIILAAGVDPKICTNDTHTWRSRNGEGLSARELAESVINGTHDKDIETHGISLLEALTHFNSTGNLRRSFINFLKHIAERLKKIEQEGYTAPVQTASVSEAPRIEKKVVFSETVETIDPTPKQDSQTTSKKKKKKKKKKGASQEEKEPQDAKNSTGNSQPTPSVTSADDSMALSGGNNDDPMVTALLGMGFTSEQINAGIRACGGINSATADAVVAWIFSEDSAESTLEPVSENEEASPPESAETSKLPELPPQDDHKTQIAINHELAKKEEARLASERLAAKREEKRLRNREWNNRAQARQKEEEQAKLAQALEQANRAATVAHAGLKATPASWKVPQQQIEHYPYSNETTNSVAPSGFYAAATPAPFAPAPQHPNHVPTMSRPQYAHQPMTGRSFEQQDFNPVPSPATAEPHYLNQHYQNHNMQTATGHNHNPVSSDITYVVADDSTVSSYGSGRLTGSSFTTSVPPPGFRPSVSSSSSAALYEDLFPGHDGHANDHQPSQADSYDGEENPLGEMRATAKVFVPTHFTPSSTPAPAGDLSNSGHFGSGGEMNASLPIPISSEHELRPNVLPSTADGVVNAPNFQTGSELLSGIGNPSFGGQGALSSSAGLGFPYERNATVTPLPDQSTFPTGATTAVPGVSNVEEGGLRYSHEVKLPQSTTFDNLPSGITPTSFDAISTAPGPAVSLVGGTSIWSGVGSTNLSSTPGVSIAGLPSLGSLAENNNHLGVFGAPVGDLVRDGSGNNGIGMVDWSNPQGTSGNGAGSETGGSIW